MLDRLIGADRAPEREALLGVLDRHLQAGLDRAERLGGDQRLGEVPGRRRRASRTLEDSPRGAVEAHVTERPRRVVAAHRLDVGALDGDHRAAVADDDQHVGTGRVGHPEDVAGHAIALERGRRRPPRAALGVDRPGALDVAGWARRHERGAPLAGGDRLDALVAAAVEQPGADQMPEQKSPVHLPVPYFSDRRPEPSAPWRFDRQVSRSPTSPSVGSMARIGSPDRPESPPTISIRFASERANWLEAKTTPSDLNCWLTSSPIGTDSPLKTHVRRSVSKPLNVTTAL